MDPVRLQVSLCKALCKQTRIKTCTRGLADECTDAVIRSTWANPAAV